MPKEPIALTREKLHEQVWSEPIVHVARRLGLSGRGLGKLCAIYDIALDDHHRALCDARAAARLLNLINKKRDDGVSAGAEQAA